MTLPRDGATTLRVSRLLSLALRHRPSVLALTLDAHGWAPVDAVLAGLAAQGILLDAAGLEDLVRSSDKQRFALSPEGDRLRAQQGHSLEIELGLSPARPPEMLHHGTLTRFLGSILDAGLVRGARTHVHLSADVPTARAVAARRRGQAVILGVRSGELHAQGHVFFVSGNGVWLTHHVPPAFLVTPDVPR